MNYAANLLLIPLLLPLGLAAQTDNTPQTIARAFALEEQGRVAEAVAFTRPLIDSGKLHGAELGRAWTVLGLAYTDQGALAPAQHAYEQAIAILQPLPENLRDYASALDNLGLLYRAMGQLDSSIGLRLKTLHIYEQLGDHSGIARACNNLASLALLQRNMKKGKEYLKRSAEEMKVATALDDDDVAAIYSMQAEFARINGNTQAAIFGYKRALQIWKRAHGEDHRNTGWGYMLLGRADADAGRIDEATEAMKQGLSILEHLLGRLNPYYLEAEIAYSRLLDETGDHDTAARLRTTDQATLKAYYQRQCIGCTISIDALR
jgi:tetratricopeptide (TPR) repeat protein